MKLYELKSGTKFKIIDNSIEEEYKFDRIDGMYSQCFDSSGNMVHLAAWTEVEEV